MRIAVFSSGNGSNLQVLLDRAASGALGASIDLVVSDMPLSRSLQRAAQAGVATLAFTPRDYPSKRDYERMIAERLRGDAIDLVVLSGYMRILTAEFIDEFKGRIINLHPSLLPAFPGAHGIRDAWRAGVAVTGCTVHAVVAEIDAGPVIARKEVAVLPGESLDELETRIHAAEHELLPAVVSRIARGEIPLPILAPVSPAMTASGAAR